MTTFKGVLKKISGCLKKTAMFAPAIVAGVGILGFIGCGFAGLAINGQVSDYVETSNYQQAVLEDTQKLNEKYENGDISLSEYTNALNEIGTSGYINKIINRDIEGNEVWQAKLKTTDALMIACLASLGGLIIAVATCIPWYIKPNLADKLDSSAFEDFNWTPPEKIALPPEDKEKHSNIIEDINKEDELSSLDDFLDNI